MRARAEPLIGALESAARERESAKTLEDVFRESSPELHAAMLANAKYVCISLVSIVASLAAESGRQSSG
jgi:hypothetical protein